jgi:glutathionyl-hydroquinone reductase
MDATGQFPDEIRDNGEFERQEDAFRALVSSNGSTHHPIKAGRYL